MKLVGILGLAGLSLLLAEPALALTISNTDPNPHTIKITAGNDTKQLTVTPNQQVDASCAQGCVVVLENGEQYQLTGTEAISIEGGTIFVDNLPGSGDDDDNGAADDKSAPDAGAAAATPDAGSPPAAK